MATKKPKPQVDTTEDLPRPPIPEDNPVIEDPAPEPTPVPAATPAPSPLSTVDKEKLLTFIEEVIDTLTFKRVALIALLTAIALVLFSLYENRTSILEFITEPPPAISQDRPALWNLSQGSIASLQTLAKTTSVGMIIVSDVDLKKNRRTARYSFIDDPTIHLENTAKQALALPLPVFDYDEKNTEQMVSILSNEFRCDSYKDTIYFRHAPELQDKYPTICRIAIPPFVGQFVGFLTVGISGTVTPGELDSIRLEVSRLAVEIYMNDVIKKVPATR